jgi:transketolase
MSFDSTVHAKAVNLTKLAFRMTAAAGSGHPTSAASLSHLVTVLMYEHMRYEPANPDHPSSDRLVLSEGHAVPIIYAACADLGVHIGHGEDTRAMTEDDAMTLREIDSPIDGHPNPIEGFPFFDSATGSLGQGLSTACGLAAAARLDGLDKRVYVLIGDGESREGQVWEAVDFLRDHDLKAVCPIFNCNVWAQTAKVSTQQLASTTKAKLEAAGYDVLEIDGHQPTAIKDALSAHAQASFDPEAAPIAIVANTVKGWGTPSQQGGGHHGSAATGDDLDQALEELDEAGREHGAHADTQMKIGLMSPKKPDAPKREDPPGFATAMQAAGQQDKFESGKYATRRAFGVSLKAMGHADSRVCSIDGDVSNSTYAELFRKDEALSERFFEGKIAEQNIISVGAGLAAGGKVPFISTFGRFLTRAYDQIEMAINTGANIKLVGSHAGISLAADGPSQMAMADVAWFRAFSNMQLPSGAPGCYVLTPSDAFQTHALMLAMTEHHGPCYLRTLRPDTEFLYGPADKFELGGHQVLSEGRDLLIVASGYMVHEANAALDALDEQGIDATLVDLYSLPFNEEALCDLANDNNGMVLTIEDNYAGGIGSAVADAVSFTGDGFTVNQMHVSRLPKSGKTPADLMWYCGLSTEHIVQRAMQMLSLSPA